MRKQGSLLRARVKGSKGIGNAEGREVREETRSSQWKQKTLLAGGVNEKEVTVRKTERGE